MQRYLAPWKWSGVKWGKVESPKPGSPAVLEPLGITKAVSSGRVATYMDIRVPVRLCKFSSTKASLSHGVCVGILVELFPDETIYVTWKWPEKKPIRNKSSETAGPMIGWMVRNAVDLPEHLKKLYTSSSEALSWHQQEKLGELLLKYISLFAAIHSDCGDLSEVIHKIDTGAARPIQQPVRPTPLAFQGQEEQLLRDMLEAGVVEPFSSEWSSPVILVHKKDGGVRWCVDHERLNSLALKDAYAYNRWVSCLVLWTLKIVTKQLSVPAIVSTNKPGCRLAPATHLVRSREPWNWSSGGSSARFFSSILTV